LQGCIEGFMMSYDLKFYRDEDGNPRCESGVPIELIGRFVTEDIQDSLNSCREILGMVERIGNGELGSWRHVGNAHALSLSADEAKVEALVVPDEKPCRLSLEDFRHIIESWLQFLERK
jgi:uncharacterized protein YacL (UPF0231 family)